MASRHVLDSGSMLATKSKCVVMPYFDPYTNTLSRVLSV